MCTAVTYHAGAHYFGRNLDLEYSLGETVTVVPRKFPLHFRAAPTMACHHAIIGMALVQDGYPLCYDAMNEHGLAMAGLNFPDYAAYYPHHAGADNITPFELIPWVLGQCADLGKAKILLRSLNLLDQNFSPDLPLTPMHWIAADKTGAIVIEPMQDGLHIHENPLGVLTNAPPFDWQMTNLSQYMALSNRPPENRLAPELALHPFSRGMGAFGLPGDLSSPSRFVRAAFTKCSASAASSETEDVSQFFHILGSVSQTQGCVLLPDAKEERTVYTSCCDLDQGVYYYTTYENSRPTAVDLRRVELEGRELMTWPLRKTMDILLEN